jgi:hypothetical protein
MEQIHLKWISFRVDVDVLVLAKLAVLECAGVSEVVVDGSISVDVVASSSGWAAAYTASALSIHLPSWQ